MADYVEISDVFNNGFKVNIKADSYENVFTKLENLLSNYFQNNSREMILKEKSEPNLKKWNKRNIYDIYEMPNSDELRNATDEITLPTPIIGKLSIYYYGSSQRFSHPDRLFTSQHFTIYLNLGSHTNNPEKIKLNDYVKKNKCELL